MARMIIAGNWKMQNDINGSVELVSGLAAGMPAKINCEVVVCPPFTSLETVYSLAKNTKISLGAQNMHFEDSGAFTGEISASMLKSVGCKYVILGHSERRAIFGESNDWINKKIKKALSSGLLPIFCIGETLEERESNITFDVIKKQVVEGLKDITAAQMADIVLAYEPVWAIGTGKTASPAQAQEVHKFIRTLLSELYGAAIAAEVTIQYGGSVKPDNAAELLSQPDINGALVGGACLKADSFIKIIEAAK